MEDKVKEIEDRRIAPTQVNGWGVDADTENDPTYPMRLRENEQTKAYDWERPPQQSGDVEVLHSNERPNLSATYGTSTPPSGLSGAIRRLAFNYSENSYAHWLPLMLADRVGVVEGVLDDLTQGHVPNVFSESGWKAEWKHNRKSLVTRIAVGAVIASAAYVYLRSRNGDSESED